MKPPYPPTHVLIKSLLALCGLGLAAAAADFRPPAVPLVTHDPYFSIWSPADKLTAADTIHWTGKPHRLTGLVRIDGKPFRVMGASPAEIPALPQQSLVVLPTRTIYTFQGHGVALTLTFMTPSLPDDLDLLSRPVTYLTWEFKAIDGRPHAVQAVFDAAGEIAADRPAQPVAWSRPDISGLATLCCGTMEQAVLAKAGDDLRIDWGYLLLAAPGGRQPLLASGDPASLRTGFCATGGLVPPGDPPAGEAAGAVGAVVFDFGRVGVEPVSLWLMIAYDDEYGIRYFGRKLRPYWRRDGAGAADLLDRAAGNYAAHKARCISFDEGLMARLKDAGGADYARLCALAYRQTLAGNKLVADSAGLPLMFPKENFSNGCIGTVDVLFPQAPFFLALSPELTRAMLVPVLDYAASPRWPYPYAPHDLGTYPHAEGQVYGMGGSEGDRMPVEECGNMLIMLAALARIDGNTAWLKPYWPMLVRWTDYLVKEGLDPRNQLCSADMFGHLPRNANLALKAIIGIGAAAQLSDGLGESETARRYHSISRDYAAKWLDLAADAGRTRLAYGADGTWSMKHNLIWDRLLGLNLIPQSVGDAEVAWYLKVQQPYGLPVDHRTDTCLIDWALWSIALAADDADFLTLFAPVCRYVNETPDRVPLSDWFITTDGRVKGFRARPVVGGIYIKLLEQVMRGARHGIPPVAGAYANPAVDLLPLVPLVPAADEQPGGWRYTTTPPGDGWFKPGFKDAAWPEGSAGFGSEGTPGAVIGTRWNTREIWLRHEVELPDVPLDGVQLWLHYDEDPEIYINGVAALSIRGWTADYGAFPLSPAARAGLQPGRNLIAVHCRQTTGGQFIDVGLAVPLPVSAGGRRWSGERARQWFDRQPLPVGFNYVPANSISYTEMWMDYSFDPVLIDRELALAGEVGFNCLRVVLPFVVWEAGEEAFKRRFEVFMALCEKRGFKVMPIFFDDCVFGPITDPVYGRQPAVVKGWYANGWTPSPGHQRARDPRMRPALERFVKDVMAAHRDDPRILCWDLYNEPGNSGMDGASLSLLRDVFRWAREINPSQPLTSGIWGGSGQVTQWLRNESDIITFHNYHPAEQLREEIRQLKQLGRPVICTEWLNRPRGSLVETCFPVFIGERVGALHWGLVNGKTQTDLPWGHKPGEPVTGPWQHDLFRPDHSSYRAAEIDCFKSNIGRLR